MLNHLVLYVFLVPLMLFDVIAYVIYRKIVYFSSYDKAILPFLQQKSIWCIRILRGIMPSTQVHG